MTEKPRLSVVIPAYNERENIPVLVDRLKAALGPTGDPYELLFVDDRSTDGSSVLLQQLHTADPRIKFLRFSRNFGHQIATTAGMAAARGDYIVLIDADLQDPPELIPAMLARAREGFDVVYMVRRRREGEGWFKRTTAALYYRLLKRITSIDIPVNTGDFRILSRRMADHLNAMPEQHRYLRGLISWVGFAQTGMEYDRDARYAGETKYPLPKMVRLALDGISGFSGAPLKLAMVLGFATALAGFLLGAYFLASKLMFEGPTVSGWLSTIIIVLFMGGVQLITIGILGEYILRIYTEAKRRPLYVIEEAALGDSPQETKTL